MATINRRRLLVGGGLGVGLVVAWGLWPRAYAPTLVAGPGEHRFGAWLKIGEDGRVTVAVPQAETGQGSWTGLAQVVADELGADWRTVGVEPAPLSPLYANPLGLEDLLEGMPAVLPDDLRGGVGAFPAPMLTAASSSARMFEEPARVAAASARALLCMAAAARWDVAWQECAVAAGFVTHAGKRLRFAALAAEAAGLTPPDRPPIGLGGAGTLMGEALPRIDAPAKVDGSAAYAGDIRLPDMVQVAVRQGPPGTVRLVSIDRTAAERVSGVVAVIEEDGWVAVAARTWWAAQRALDAAAPRFEVNGVLDDAGIERALIASLDGPGQRIVEEGDLAAAFRDATLVTARYHARPAVHAAIETPSAAAAFADGRLSLWLSTEAPGLARAAAARAASLSEGDVTVHPMPVGGDFGQGLDHLVAEQAARIAMRLKRPVSVTWSRGEALLHDRYRPPAEARMAARLATNGAILGWQARIASPATGRALVRALAPALDRAGLRLDAADRYAVGGARPPYRVPAMAIDHHPAEIGLPTGHLRGGAHGYTCFFTESFVDELAQAAMSEPMSYRIGMLGGQPRLARCLSTASSLGGWEGGVRGSGQGIAAHAFRGSFVAVMAEAHVEGGMPKVDRLVAAVDCGRVINPELVRQQVEGGLIFGLAHALGAATGMQGGLATVRGFDRLWLPRLADTPDITVELIRSDEAPGGVSELGVPAVAPAIANALWTVTGRRIRSLPLV
ncbi:xanthine dehydrogenase family protein molybdopterin-binding subunit [Sphingomonas rubra]|uniref:Isoquinoline 1-oxidoreductase, beta subunit n=1 Tax=Sphingomonas rubra TaxID=634430 RepID=A0A1I5SCW7_9SPHN|nr:molybdopterin cofactor-binding domain-containing protein [Sphingomonas rubra]SFP68594.1 isoquinoline 1-oxidoreductase, beta subunit [Sphingomonas rubra]